MENSTRKVPRESIKDKLTINQFIKANDLRNKKLQIEKKLKQVDQEEKLLVPKLDNKLQKTSADIKDLKMRRLYYQMKLKLFYFEQLESLHKPAKEGITAPILVRKLWRIKGCL